MYEFGYGAFRECPWCGSNEIKVKKTVKGTFFAKCLKCKSRGPSNKDDEMTAVKEWNIRKPL